MAKAYLFYNPLAGGGQILEDLEALEFVLDEETVLCDMTKPETYAQTLFGMNREDYFVVCGGDGTLNRFVNLTGQLHRPNEVYYYPAGTNNDFALDFGRRYGNNPFCVTKPLQALPQVRMGGKSGSFLTGILFQTGSGFRRFSRKRPCYYNENTPNTVRISVDRSLRCYEKVRFAAVMYGRHCGGGMTPDVSRNRTDRDLSCVIIHGCGPCKANYLYHQLRKGRSVHSRHFSILRGRNLQLSFRSPVCLRTDGEIQTGVTELVVICPKEGNRE